jgi:PAS domain S-box-containing protein
MEGRVSSWNPAAERIFGYLAAEAIGQPIIALIVPEESEVLEQVHRIAEGLIHQAQPSRSEHVNRRKDGSLLFCRWFNTPLTDEVGRPLGVASMALDVTEIRQATQALMESEQRFRTVADYTHDWEYWFDQHGHLVWMSPSCERITGYPVSAFLQEPELIYRICHPADRDHVRDHARHAAGVRCEAPLDYRIHHRDGREVWISHVCTSVVDSRGNPAGRRATNVDVTARKRAEEALREREERYRAFFTHGPDGVVVLDPATMRPVEFNDQVCRQLGYTREEFGALTMADIEAVETSEETARRIQKVMDEGYDDFLTLQRTKQGALRSIHVTAQYIRMGGENTYHCVWRDITEQRQAEAALQESEQRFRMIFEKAIDGIILFSTDGQLLDANEAFANMHGRTREEVKALRIMDLNAPEANALVPERISSMLAGETLKIELRQIRKDGSSFMSEATASMVSFSGKPAILSFHRDITDRKQAEEALRDSEARLQRAESVSRLGNWELNLGDGTIRGSRGAQAIYGLEGEPWSLASVQAVPLPEYRPMLDAQLADLIASGGPYTAEFQIRRPSDGQVLDIHSIAEFDPERRIVFGVLNDITERKKAEREKVGLMAQLQQAQKMESLGTLAGGIAHDMNNVLGAILGLASANLEFQPKGSPAHRAFDTIAKAATRGGDMVKSLLSFARQSQAEARQLDLNALLLEQAELLARTTLSKVQLRLDLAPDLSPMCGDEGALSHVFMNLCVNAVDAMPANGTLTLRTRNVGQDGIEVTVEDTGVGMSQEVLERAMEPFFTTKEVGKGTGLGLSMVYSTVKAHQGQVDIHSQPGVGTVVRLRFPACSIAGPAVVPVGEPQPDASVRALKVLLVDDDDLIQSAMAGILQALGHTIAIASCGEEALEALEGGPLPDVVILDMNMPGLGGAGTLPRLRALAPRVPVLLSTGRADQTALDLAEAYPFVTLLPKPFSLKELQRRLDLLGQPG